MSSGFRSNYQLYSITILLEFELLSLFVDTMPPRRERDSPHRIYVDEEAASAPHDPLSHDDPLIPPEFSIPLVSQAEPFPPMSLKAFQAFITC